MNVLKRSRVYLSGSNFKEGKVWISGIRNLMILIIQAVKLSSSCMLIDVGLDSDNIYNITVLASDDKKDMDAPLCVVKFSDRAMLHDKLQEIIGRFREGAHENEAEEENEIRIAELIEKYGSDFLHAPKEEIRTLINEELEANNGDDPEYLRLLCAILFCVGDKEDAHLIKKVKFSGSMDLLDAIDKEIQRRIDVANGN